MRESDDEGVKAKAPSNIDALQQRFGIAALLSAAVIVPVLAFSVASALGMGLGSAGNDGLGVPLSLEESAALSARAGMRVSAKQEEERLAQGLTAEEAREEEALVRILRSEPLRGR